MKKIIAGILTLLLTVSFTACGGNGGGEKKTPETYYRLLESRDSTYYYEAEVEEVFPDESEEVEKSLFGEARDGKGNLVVLGGTEKELDTRQIEKGETFYYVYDPDKEYTEESIEEDEPMKMTFVESSEMKLDGKMFQYSEYQDEYEMESFIDEDGDTIATDEFLYRQQYLVDEKGDLYAIISIQEQKGADGEENTLICRRTERIKKFKEGSYPEGIFDIPDDYKKIDGEDELYLDDDEVYLDEEVTEEE